MRAFYSQTTSYLLCSHPFFKSALVVKKKVSYPLGGEALCLRGFLLLAGALAWFPFMAQPLQHLDGFELPPFFLLLRLNLRFLMEV